MRAKDNQGDVRTNCGLENTLEGMAYDYTQFYGMFGKLSREKRLQSCIDLFAAIDDHVLLGIWWRLGPTR